MFGRRHRSNGVLRSAALAAVGSGGLVLALLPSATARANVNDIGVPGSPPSVHAAEGNNNLFLGTFTEGDNTNPGNYSVTIDWGDGSPTTSGQVNNAFDNNANDFSVFGGHTYASEGAATQITVMVSNTGDGDTGTWYDSVTVDMNNNCQAVSLCPQMVSVVEGQSFTGTVGVFGDADAANASAFTASIQWGDGSTTTGTVSADPVSGYFDVTGTHTYTEWAPPMNCDADHDGDFGSPPFGGDNDGDLVDDTNGCPGYNIGVQVYDSDGASLTFQSGNALNDGVFVTEGTLNQTGSNTFSVKAGRANAQTLITFSDSDPAAMSSDYSASINWGDGKTSVGLVTGPTGGPFAVSGSHTYKKAGSYTISISLGESDNSATNATMHDFATIHH